MKKKRSFHHLDEFKRDRLEALIRMGHSQSDIAKIVKVDKSTISREISKRKRKNGVYDADAAQHKARVKRLYSKYQGMKVENDPELKKKIIAELTKCRSPDEIAGRLKKEMGLIVGKDAIYKWLYSVFGQRYCQYLCSKRYRKRKQTKKPKREMIKHRIPLFLRPYGKNCRHAEGDAFLSPKKSKTTASVFVICEKTSRLLSGKRMPNLKPAVVAETARTIADSLNLDTLTLDNGQENREHLKMGIATYFCDPHSPWQKPHVECGIGLIRRWFIPKKTDLRKIDDIQLQEYIHILNNKYRKSLGYRNAYEAAFEHGVIKSLPNFISN